MPGYRRYYQNPYFQVFQLSTELLNGQERMPDGLHVPKALAPSIGRWYFGPPGQPYPFKRFGPYKSHAKALEAAQEHFKNK